MKIVGLNNFVRKNVSGAKNKKINNTQTNNILTSPLNNISQDKVSFGMKGSGRVNDMKDLLAYVGRDNAGKILRILQKCRYSKTDVLTSNKSRAVFKNGKLFLTNFSSEDDDKIRGNCRELMLKAGAQMKKDCPNLNVHSMAIFNKDYGMSHCVLAVTRKGSSEDKAVASKSFELDNDILIIDPSFRSFKMDLYKPLISRITDIEDEIRIEKQKKGTVELNVDEPVVMGSYADIAMDLNLPPISQKFGIETKPPLIAINYNGRQVNAKIASPLQRNGDKIISFAVKNLSDYMHNFLQSI